MKRTLICVVVGYFILICPSLGLGLNIPYDRSWSYLGTGTGTNNPVDPPTDPSDISDPTGENENSDHFQIPDTSIDPVINPIDTPTQGAAPVPEPATMLLLGTGLISIVGLKKRLKKD